MKIFSSIHPIIDNIRIMDWKRPYYMRSDVIDHPKFTVVTGGTFYISYKLQIRVCWLQLGYKASTLSGDWTGYGYW